MPDLQTSRSVSAAFLTTAGETGALIAAHDWTGTSLGAIESWPQSLMTALGTVLCSPVPIVMLWGEEGIMLYNDAYSVFAGGRHPQLLGSKVREGWPEVAEFNDNVMKVVLAGGTLAYRDQELTLYRHGVPEQVFMNLDYSPVPDESGRPAGVIAIVVETTQRVAAERRLAFRLNLEEQLRGLRDPRAIMDATVTALGRHLGAARVGYCQVQGDGKTIVCESCFADGVNPLSGTFALDSFGPGSVARQLHGVTEVCVDSAADPQQVQEAWAAIDTRAFVSVPLVRDGCLKASLYVNARDPRRWSKGEVALIEDVAAGSWDAVDRAMAERASRESEARFRTLTELSPDAILIKKDDRFVYANAAAARVCGTDSAADLIGRTPADLYSSEYLELTHQRTQRILSGERVETVEIAIIRPDGSRIPVEVNAGLISWDGAPAIELLLRDATERRAAEEALRASEARLRLALEAGRLAEVTFDLVGAGVTHSPVFADLLGHPVDKTLSLGEIRARYHPEDCGRVLAERAAILEGTDDFYNKEFRVVRLDGEVRWLYGRGRVSRDDRGRPLSMTVVYLDDTDRKAAELALRHLNQTLESQVAERTAELQANQARMRVAFETSYIFQGLLSPDGTVVDVNGTSLESIQCRRDEVVGLPFWDTPWFTGTPGMTDVVRHAVDRVAHGETFRREIQVNLHDGWRWFDFSMRPIHDETGQMIAIVPEAAELTERRMAEEALRQSQKLEAMGQLTGGVAHDFNNLLTPILGGLDMLQRRGVGGAREQRIIDGALQSAERARTLVQRLLAFSRRQPLQPTAVDVARLITGMAELIGSTLGPQIRVVVQMDEDLPAARADPNQLEMALLNLAVNARDAMPDGGTLRILAAVESLDPGHRTQLPPGPYIHLSVVDTGAGMDDTTLARAIEPFFSTKGIGKGTGLGLSMVHGLASQLGGALSLRSKPGIGTHVELWLPASAEPLRAGDASSADAAGQLPTLGTVLLVDDEDLVRASSADMLAELGYAVVEANSAESALGLVDAGLAPDVLVTDHLMPGMSGTDLAEALRARHPDLPVLLVSGYADVEGLSPGLPCLTKPFRNVDLASSLAALVPAAARGVVARG